MSLESISVQPSTTASDPDVATHRVAGIDYQVIKLAVGDVNTVREVTDANGIPVQLAPGAATEASLSALNAKTPGLGQALAAASQPVVLASNQTAVPVSFTSTALTDAQLRAAALPVSGPLTNAELRAASVNVAIISDTGLTDTQLRASAVPVSVASQPLPIGASTEATLAALNTKIPATPAIDRTTSAAPFAVRQSDGTNFIAPALEGGNLATLAARTPALGAALPAASRPVTLPNDVVVTGGSTIAALNIDLLTNVASGWFDAANYHSASIQIVGGAGITAGQIFFEQTNDISAANAGNFWPVDENSLTPTPNIAALAITASTVRMFGGAVTSRYVRVRVSTAFTGGGVQAIAVFSQLPYFRQVQTVHQATAGNLQVTANGTVTANQGSANATPWLANPVTNQFTAEASSAKTVSGNSAAAITNVSYSGVMLFLNVSAATGTSPTLAVKVQVQDPVSLGWVDVPGASFASVIAVTPTPLMLTLNQGITAVANAAVNIPLPRTWRLAWTLGGTTPSFTFSVGAQYLL